VLYSFNRIEMSGISMSQTEILTRLAVALGIGLLVGLERGVANP
jgi:uncharacterized membrane protein YhiD involved in acid resistance